MRTRSVEQELGTIIGQQTGEQLSSVEKLQAAVDFGDLVDNFMWHHADKARDNQRGGMDAGKPAIAEISLEATVPHGVRNESAAEGKIPLGVRRVIGVVEWSERRGGGPHREVSLSTFDADGDIVDYRRYFMAPNGSEVLCSMVNHMPEYLDSSRQADEETDEEIDSESEPRALEDGWPVSPDEISELTEILWADPHPKALSQGL